MLSASELNARGWTSALRAPLILLASLGTLTAAETNTVRFTGKVTGQDARPLPGARVTINRVSGAPIAGDFSALNTVTEPNGTFNLPLRLRSTTVATVECELWFEYPGFVRHDRVVTVGANRDLTETLDVTLQRGLVLSGTVRFPSNRNAQATGPYLLQIMGDNFEQYSLTDKAGSFAAYVPSGEYRLRAQNAGKSIEVAGVKAGTTNLAIEAVPFVWSEASVGKVFDDFWREMDLKYSYFFLKTNVDWAALGKEFRPQAAAAKDADELAKVLQKMLSPLRDLHIWIESPVGVLGAYSSSVALNGNGKVTRAAIAETAQCGKFALVGRTKADGFGYLLILRQSNATEELVKQTIAAMEALRNTPGFIVDLRGANGGSEPFAQTIAQFFCGNDTVYARSRYRNGPGHEDFTEAYGRTLKASENPYTNPVVCLVGPGAVSSGEGFAKMMMALPQVTTVGMPTRGASGNPKPYPLGDTGVTVTFSRWVDLLPNGASFEGRGIPPQFVVDLPASAYAEHDPTLEKGFEILRRKISEK